MLHLIFLAVMIISGTLGGAVPKFAKGEKFSVAMRKSLYSGTTIGVIVYCINVYLGRI